MAGPVAVLDADVLVPILSCDLLLTAFDHDLFQPVVTPKILDEVERNLLSAFPQHDPTALVRRVDQMRQALALHTRDDAHEGDVAESINRKDRHVVAAALASAADVIITNDRRLRTEVEALSEPLRAASADDFAVGLLTQSPDAVEQVINDLITKRVRRPMSRHELLDRMADAFPAFVTGLDPDR